MESGLIREPLFLAPPLERNLNCARRVAGLKSANYFNIQNPSAI